MSTGILDNVISSAAEVAAKRRKTQDAKFSALVKQIVASKRPDGAAVDAALSAAGKTLDDLRAAVSLHQQRQQHAENIRKAEGLAGELAQIDEKLAAAYAEYQVAEAKYNAAVAPQQI